MAGPFHVRRIEITDHDASHEWPFEVADTSGQTVLAFPFEAIMTPLAPAADDAATADEHPYPDQLTSEDDGVSPRHGRG